MTDPAPLGRVAIVGAGQVGTMLGRALRAAGPDVGVHEILLHDARPEAAMESLARGAGDRVVGSVAEALDADTVIVATPVPVIVRIVDQLAGTDPVRAGPFVIDTGSAKGTVVEAMRRLPAGVHAMGGHPLAGTEQPGPGGAEPERLAGATFVLTPVRDDPEALRRARALVEAIGARALVMDARDHDRAVAMTSHAPHVVAFALASAVGGAGESDAAAVRDLVGSGFRGTTRLAASDPAMTAGFLAANAVALHESLGRFREAIDLLEASLEMPEDLERLLAEARSARTALIGTDRPVDPVRARSR